MHVATAMSNSVCSNEVETRVVYVAPSMWRRARKRRTMSPPRAGMTALTPVPATYEPKIGNHLIRACGYAARRMFRQARDTATSFASWAAMPTASHFHSTDARW
jgi:hypothetical protein